MSKTVFPFQIYHIEEPSECRRGCGTLLVRIEGIAETGMLRVSCEALANIETDALQLKVHNECPALEKDDKA